MKNWLQFSHHQTDHVIDWDQRRYTFKELDEYLVSQFTNLLEQQGCVEHEHIAVITHSPWVQFVSLLACTKLGLVFFPVSIKSPMHYQQSLIKQAGISLIIEGDSKPKVTRISPVPERVHQLHDSAILISTSGSSSIPKAVILNHQALISSATLSNKVLSLNSQDCWLNILPLHHIGGISIVIRTALAGAKMILHQGFNASAVWNDIITKQITHISLVPTMLEKILQATDSSPPSRLKVVLIGGAALSPALANKALDAGWPIWSTYGMSETASQVATGKLETPHNNFIPTLTGVQTKVLFNEKLLSQGSGQLYLQTPTMMTGYANEQNKPGLGLENNWLKTGDIATLDGQGNISITGRGDDVIISGGENIHPAEIEAILLTCPGITAACIIGKQDATWGQKLCAVYSGHYTSSQLEQWCRKNLSGIFLPRLYYQIDQLPELANGKIDRQRVQQIYS